MTCWQTSASRTSPRTSISPRSNPPANPAAARPHHEEGERDEEEEGDVNQRECLFAPIVKENPAEPVLDKRAGIARSLTRADPQLLFPRGQRADDAGQRFREHKTDGQKMSHAKTQVAHKRPAAKVADPDDDESHDDKRDE